MVFFSSCSTTPTIVVVAPKALQRKLPPLELAEKVVFNSVNKISLTVRQSKTMTISDQSIINKILKLFNEHTQIRDHKCSSVAILIFESETGGNILSLLPGHNKKFYEFRFNQAIYKIHRERLFLIPSFKKFETALLKHGK